jgi:isopentenyl diphosphate isomerase/L-lactate dehydrogenase-like FMN-dependent dehydrogenase
LPTRIDAAVNLDDLRKLAKRRLPKLAYDFIEGGLDGEEGLSHNENAFKRLHLVPRYGVDVTVRDQSATIFGRTYSGPVGIAPTGGAALFRRGGDMMLAEAARAANVPFIMSGAATGSIEELGRVAPEHGWYQLYIARDRKISEDMIRRVADAGLSTLVVTLDVPVSSNRERNRRNGFVRPLKLTFKTKLEACLHPGWLAEFMRLGPPMLSNWQAYAPKGASAEDVATFVTTQMPTPVLWQDIESFRRLWRGKLVLKGVMHPDDATRAAAIGVDGIMVSNHGARQLDRAPSPIEVLPAINAAVGEKMTVMLDGGIRRGSDVVTALCLGAKYVFVGRPTLYGVTAGGCAGATRALAIFRNEIDLVMANMGAPDLKSLGPQFLMWKDEDDRRRNVRP